MSLSYYEFMFKRSQSWSIAALLALAYLVITLPAAVFIGFTSRALDYRIEQAQLSEVDGDKFALDTTPRSTWFIQTGRLLREMGAPLSKSPRLKPDNNNNRRVALALSDIRTAVIYIWSAIFVMGALALTILGLKLNRPLAALTGSIDRLADGDLSEPVTISGPTNIEKMGVGLEALRRRLQESGEQQTLFLRHISHEIKTPLTSIKEGSKLLEDELLGTLNKEQKDVSSIMVKSSNELQTAIENLLNYSAAISRKNIKRRRKTDLATLVTRALEKHVLQIRQKGLRLVTEIKSIAKFVDPDQIQTVFENLISNAIKHSPNGGKLHLRLLGLPSGDAEFLIQDEGPGVLKEQKSAIFDAFFVGDQAVKSTLKGTGLGLSIAKQYVDAHRGSIRLVETRKGAAFKVILS